MGRWSGELVCLPLCKKGSTPLDCIGLGNIFSFTVQPASDVRRVALRDAVCVHSGGYSEYIQKISLRHFILPEDESGGATVCYRHGSGSASC